MTTTEQTWVVPGALVWARRPLTYAARAYANGEVFALRGLRNDLLLADQHLIVKLEGEPTACTEEDCTAEFADEPALHVHVLRTHTSSESEAIATAGTY